MLPGAGLSGAANGVLEPLLALSSPFSPFLLSFVTCSPTHNRYHSLFLCRCRFAIFASFFRSSLTLAHFQAFLRYFYSLGVKQHNECLLPSPSAQVFSIPFLLHGKSSSGDASMYTAQISVIQLQSRKSSSWVVYLHICQLSQRLQLDALGIATVCPSI